MFVICALELELELELELIQTHMTQKPMQTAEAGTCVWRMLVKKICGWKEMAGVMCAECTREFRLSTLIFDRNRDEQAIFCGPRPMYAYASDFRYGPFRLGFGRR